MPSNRLVANYLQTVCQFLKLPDACPNGYKSNFLQFDFAFGLNLADDCGFENETISDVYFLSNTKDIFSFSVFDFKLDPMKHTDSKSDEKRAYNTLVPLSDMISMLNNKNLPNIFIFFPIASGFTSQNLSLTVKFDEFEKHDFKEHQTTRLVLDDRPDLLENCTRLNENSLLDKTDRLKSSYSGPSIRRPSSKRLNSNGGNFHGHLQVPAPIRKILTSDPFIADQNSINRSLFLRMQFAFDGGSVISQTGFDQRIASLRGTLVMIHCSKVRPPNFITYACETITDYDESLECYCDYFEPTAFVRYDRFAVILIGLIVGIFLVRSIRVLLDHVKKWLLFKRTIQDRTLYILCSNRTALYAYTITLELGCASPSFDFDTTCIDFELQGPDGQRMTQGRIPSKMLFKERINQINFKLMRLTQLNRSMLDSVSIKHNCSNPNAKIFLYDLILSQIDDPKIEYRFSLNDYIRAYRQRYVLTVNTFANLSLCERDSSKDGRLRQAESSGAPNQIKSCELFPTKRIHLQPFPNLNNFEVNLILFFALLCSFLVNIWLIKHRLCIKRSFLCYFNHFKISFFLTSMVYLLAFSIYRLLKHHKMKALYLKRSSTWSYGIPFLNLVTCIASFVVAAKIWTSNLTLHMADFYALSLSSAFIIPIFILCVDLINFFIENLSFKNSLTFRSFRSSKSSDQIKPEKTIRSGVMDNFISYRSTEFKPSVDYSTETNDENGYSSTRLPTSNELDDLYLELKNQKSSRKSIGSENSIKSVKSFSLSPTDNLMAKAGQQQLKKPSIRDDS